MWVHKATPATFPNVAQNDDDRLVLRNPWWIRLILLVFAILGTAIFYLICIKADAEMPMAARIIAALVTVPFSLFLYLGALVPDVTIFDFQERLVKRRIGWGPIAHAPSYPFGDIKSISVVSTTRNMNAMDPGLPNIQSKELFTVFVIRSDSQGGSRRINVTNGGDRQRVDEFAQDLARKIGAGYEGIVDRSSILLG